MNFIRASTKAPCPVCKKTDWCRVFPDGFAECMRVESATPAKSGGWMHRVADGPKKFNPPPRYAPPSINATKMHREWLAATTQHALEELATSLNLSVTSVRASEAAWADRHSAWAFPMKDGYGNTVGIRLRGDNGKKWAVAGSKQGIFIPVCVSQETLFITEGPTDTAAAIELGLFAAGRPNCCCGGPELKVLARRSGAKQAVLISDNDKPGLDGAKKVGMELKMPFAIYVPMAKDLREFVRLGGSKKIIENTIKSTVWHNT